MKRTIFIILLSVILFLLFGAYHVKPSPRKGYCRGYRVLEAGVGIDCHGDTVALIKKGGFYQLADRN